MGFLDYYSILGVPFGATQEQIERAYKLLVRMSHPDAFPNDSQAQAWANERMKQIHEAYDVLRGPSKRANYDYGYHAAKASADQRQVPEQPPERRVSCPLCEGAGETLCLTCGGQGSELCPSCAGARRVICPICHGERTVTETDYWRLVAEVERAKRQAEEAGHQRAAADAKRLQAEEARARQSRVAALSWLVFLVMLTTFLIVRSRADQAVQQLVARRLSLPTSYARPESTKARIDVPATTARPLPVLRSQHSQYSVEYRFLNRTGRALKAFWVDYSGREVYYATILPGRAWTVATYATHPWRLRDARTGRVAFTVIAKQRNTEVSLLPPK